MGVVKMKRSRLAFGACVALCGWVLSPPAGIAQIVQSQPVTGTKPVAIPEKVTGQEFFTGAVKHLGVPVGPVAVQPLLETAVRAYGAGNLADGDRAADALVDKITNPPGADLSAYSESVLATARIGSAGGFGDLPGATLGERLRLTSLLWNRARTVGGDRGARGARAVLALSAAERFEMRYGFARRLLTLNAVEFYRVAAMKNAEVVELGRLWAAADQSRAVVAIAAHASMRATDAVSVVPSDQPIPDPLVEAALARLADWRSAADGDVDLAYDVVQQAWLLRNVGRTRRAEKLERGAVAFLRDWATSPAGQAQPVHGWIDDALRVDADPGAGPQVVELKADDPKSAEMRARLEQYWREHGGTGVGTTGDQTEGGK